jgi:hypothetical protein
VVQMPTFVFKYLQIPAVEKSKLVY